MAIFGRDRLDHICNQFDLRFRDEPSYIQAFYELQAFGLYSIIDGVKTQCGYDLRTVILATLNELFEEISGPNWEMMWHRVAEYEEFGKQAPTGGLAAQRIFDQPPGVIQPTSMEAYDLSHTMNRCYIDAVKAIEGLFKEYKVAIPTD